MLASDVNEALCFSARIKYLETRFPTQILEITNCNFLLRVFAKKKKKKASMTNIWVTVMKILEIQETGQTQSGFYLRSWISIFFSPFTYLFICSQSNSINCNVLTGTSLALLWSESSSEDRCLRGCLEREKLDLNPRPIEHFGCYLLFQEESYTWLWIVHLFGTVASFDSLS